MPKTLGYLVFALMLAASLSAMALKPTHKMAADAQKLVLEQTIPLAFGDWKVLDTAAPLVNPQTEAAINKIYAQTLSRTYANAQGDVVMLSIAYGEDQSDSVGAHLPEGCYGGQGFAVSQIKRTHVNTAYADIPTTTLLATKGNRVEPITYWLRTGQQVTYPGWDTKRLKLSYAFKGDIPDGLLLRVSSITDDAEAGYLLQKQFVDALLAGLSQEQRLYLIGYHQKIKEN